MNSEKIKNLSFSDLLTTLLQYLEGKSYTQLTLDNYRKTLKKIEPYMISEGIHNYLPELGVRYYKDYFVDHELGSSRQKAMITEIQRLNNFYSGTEYIIQQKQEIKLLTDEYEHVLDLFTLHCTEVGNKPITLKSKM